MIRLRVFIRQRIYISTFRTAIEEAERSFSGGRAEREVLDHARRYYDNAFYNYEKGDYITGLITMMPSRPHDAKGMLKAAKRSEDLLRELQKDRSLGIYRIIAPGGNIAAEKEPDLPREFFDNYVRLND